MTRVFRNPASLSKEQASTVLASDSVEAIAECLVGLAFNESDTDFVWRAIRGHIEHTNPTIRGIAILCIGHMARIHGWIPAEWAKDSVEHGLKDVDAWVRGHAESASDDIEVFKPIPRPLGPERG